MFLASACSGLCAIYWSQVLGGEWRCSWSSADRQLHLSEQQFNCLLIASYVRDLTGYVNRHAWLLQILSFSDCEWTSAICVLVWPRDNILLYIDLGQHCFGTLGNGLLPDGIKPRPEQYWPIISEDMCHPPETNLTDILKIHYVILKIAKFMVTVAPPMCQWLNINGQ